MRGINFVGILVGVYLLWQSYLLIRRREESVFNFYVWLLVGAGLIMAGLFPGVFEYIIDVLGMEERAFAMFAIGIFILYLLVFHIFQQIRLLESSLSSMNEELSLMRQGFTQKSLPREEYDGESEPARKLD